MFYEGWNIIIDFPCFETQAFVKDEAKKAAAGKSRVLKTKEDFMWIDNIR